MCEANAHVLAVGRYVPGLFAQQLANSRDDSTIDTKELELLPVGQQGPETTGLSGHHVVAGDPLLGHGLEQVGQIISVRWLGQVIKVIDAPGPVRKLC